ncbi:sensor histidine kinase [Lichenihabitans psoromatis]|uniref:sensor histidine kinase n=1 Tax=Lichenihabitans psoromatis TaxID=2528642 RepID=UPI0010362789|nr:response regulator [Lichenihabitans psoromatis]
MTSARILYIDDDPALLRLIERQLQRRGYAVEAVSSGEDGLARIAAGTIDCVALDHYMPGQDGLTTLLRICDLPDPPPVIYVTGTNESSIAVAALKAGAADYVVKDVQGAFYDLLDAAIRSAIESTALRRQKAETDREIRAARDRFEALAAERQVLMREVNHRVGNSLQLVAAFLHMQASSADAATRAALADANRRVLAIAQVHRRLYASDDVTAVALHHYLAGLIEDLRQSADAQEATSQLVLLADEIEINPDTAVTIGIIVTELVINAMKYAYPTGSGPIRVRLEAVTCRQTRLIVEDEGVGKVATEKSGTRTGIGRSIVKAMATKLATTVEYRSDGPGTHASMLFSNTDSI